MATELITDDEQSQDPNVPIDFDSDNPIPLCPLRESDTDEICESCQ